MPSALGIFRGKFIFHLQLRKACGLFGAAFSQEGPELSDAVFLCGLFWEKCNTGQTAGCPVLL
jgi:hypothetical protein